MAAGLFLPGFEVWRADRTGDGAGGWIETYRPVGSAVSGRLSPLSGASQIVADQQRGVVSLRFSTAAATDVRPGDQIRRGGRVVTVEAVRLTSSGRRKEAVCVERQEG